MLTESVLQQLLSKFEMRAKKRQEVYQKLGVTDYQK